MVIRPKYSLKVMATIAGLAAIATMSASAMESARICKDVYQDATRNITKSVEVSEVVHDLYSRYCRADGSTKGNAVDFGLAYEALDVNFSFSSSENKHSEFCSTEYENFKDYVRIDRYDNHVVVAALSSFNDCISSAKQGMAISHTDYGNGTVVIHGRSFDPNFKPTIDNIVADESFTCTSVDFNSRGKKRVVRGDKVLEPNGHSWNISCTREPELDGTNVIYPRTSIGVATSAGTYVATLIESTRLGFRDAKALISETDRLAAELDQTKAALNEAQAKADAEEARANSIGVLKWGTFSLGEYDGPALFRPRLDSRNGLPSQYRINGLTSPSNFSNTTLADDYARYLCNGSKFVRYELRSRPGGCCGYSDHIVICLGEIQD